MEGFEVLILIGRLFLSLITQISTKILKLKRDFRRKQKWSQKITLFQGHSVLHRHYKHNDKEVRVFESVKIG